MEDCIFCKIIEGSIPSQKVYEDEQLIAVRDINPAAPTHVLFIPRKHVATLNDIGDMPDETLASLLRAAAGVAAEEGVDEEGYRVVINCNRAGGQEIFHLHVHLLGGRPMGRMG
ncbi:MAG: histidine triad nucleotide-binding protein [Pseudomonadota bacterium]